MNFKTAEPAWAEDERQALLAQQRGRQQEALEAWARVLAQEPAHIVALTHVGQVAYAHGDLEAALHAFQRAADAEPADPRSWVNLALVHQKRGDATAEDAALTRALTADPSDLMALYLRGQLAERLGDERRAASAYGAAATVSPPMDRLRPDLRPAVQYAAQYRERYQRKLAAYMDDAMRPHYAEVAGDDVERFRLSLDILVGRKQRYDSLPMRYFVPHLPVVEFFDRALFPWIEEFETHTDAITEELTAVVREDRGMEPYIHYRPDEPIAQWAELNHSPRWSAFHLWKEGRPVPENVARCPRTVAAWQRTPRPEQPGRTPVAMYSLLKPRTRIPPHVGASNARLVCHLPLIVPPGCTFRVGNSVRSWERGRVWVFDDTIEHEAINDSDQLRVVMIFDTWHPMLTPAERRLITAMNTALNGFGETAEAYDV